MRPPEGEYSERVLAVAKDMGYRDNSVGALRTRIGT